MEILDTQEVVETMANLVQLVNAGGTAAVFARFAFAQGMLIIHDPEREDGEINIKLGDYFYVVEKDETVDSPLTYLLTALKQRGKKYHNKNWSYNLLVVNRDKNESCFYVINNDQVEEEIHLQLPFQTIKLNGCLNIFMKDLYANAN